MSEKPRELREGESLLMENEGGATPPTPPQPSDPAPPAEEPLGSPTEGEGTSNG